MIIKSLKVKINLIELLLINEKNCFYKYTIICSTYTKIIVSKWISSFCYYTQPPNKSQRVKVKKLASSKYGRNFKLEIRTPHKLKNNSEEYNYFQNLKATAIVVAYGQIIPEEYLNLTKFDL